MASSMMVSSATVMVPRSTTPAQSTLVAPYTGLKSAGALPIARRTATNLNHLPSNGGRAHCMLVWPIEGRKKFETLSYLPPLTDERLLKQIEYLIRSGWIPCLEFSTVGFVFRENHRSPGYYDGRYWTMWKLPMFGCTDAVQVIKELVECKKEFPEKFVRIIGFDNRRQVQCISFIAYKPEGKDY
ncbi:ribulose bisphosphate carboxylase small chain, chloroplastic [Dendrobium catenatum]|nr:ribulose bisphosphate carboxylase small chain, chloroplastic [Dendrobium catenatum]